MSSISVSLFQLSKLYIDYFISCVYSWIHIQIECLIYELIGSQMLKITRQKLSTDLGIHKCILYAILTLFLMIKNENKICSYIPKVL